MTKQSDFKRRVRARMAKTGESYTTGVDRWIGGVHLTGRHVRWRWDDGTETIVGPID